MLVVAAEAAVSLHRTWSEVVVLYAIFMGLWGLFLAARRSGPTGGYLGALVIAEGVIGIQGLIGLVLVVQGHRPAQSLHFLYGFVAFLTLPAAYLYTQNGTVRGSSLILGLASLFLLGLCIRAITTGGT